jgi:Dockerin type I domain
MNPRHSLLWTMLVGFAAAATASSRAMADPPDILRNYRFITAKSTVDVTTSTGVEMPLNILGRFGLETGYNYDTSGPTGDTPTLVPYAQFTDVNAILFDPRRASPLPSPGWDLDETLNLSGLTGTFSVPDDLYFLGADGQGQALLLEAALSGPLLHLTGGTIDPCCNFDRYAVDAWAHQLPWADFNGDGSVDDADFTVWRENFGKSVSAGAEGDANGDGVVNAADYTIWRDEVGQSDGMAAGLVLGSVAVPEPASMVLMMIGALLLSITMGRRAISG